MTTTTISNTSNTARVPEIDYGDYEQFLAATERGTRPVVINGAMDDWKALETWNLDYFRSRFGETTVRVTASRDGICRGDPALGFSHVFRHMPLREFLDSVAPDADANRTERYYLQLLAMRGEFVELREAITIPHLIHSPERPGMFLWIGAAGNVTALHFDESFNFLAQVVGRKRLVLFSPDQTELLYPHAADSKIPTMSQVDVERPDFEAFPRFREAQGIEVTIGPGQMLYIPLFWWHTVRSLDPSISVNFWWMPPGQRM
jgi:hypothetical protein